MTENHFNLHILTGRRCLFRSKNAQTKFYSTKYFACASINITEKIYKMCLSSTKSSKRDKSPMKMTGNLIQFAWNIGYTCAYFLSFFSSQICISCSHSWILHCFRFTSRRTAAILICVVVCDSRIESTRKSIIALGLIASIDNDIIRLIE